MTGLETPMAERPLPDVQKPPPQNLEATFIQVFQTLWNEMQFSEADISPLQLEVTGEQGNNRSCPTGERF